MRPFQCWVIDIGVQLARLNDLVFVASLLVFWCAPFERVSLLCVVGAAAIKTRSWHGQIWRHRVAHNISLAISCYCWCLYKVLFLENNQEKVVRALRNTSWVAKTHIFNRRPFSWQSKKNIFPYNELSYIKQILSCAKKHRLPNANIHKSKIKRKSVYTFIFWFFFLVRSNSRVDPPHHQTLAVVRAYRRLPFSRPGLAAAPR